MNCKFLDRYQQKSTPAINRMATNLLLIVESARVGIRTFIPDDISIS